MQLFLKIALWIAGGLVGIVLLVLVGIWLVSSMTLGKKYDAPQIAMTHSTNAQTIAYGKRIAKIMGCDGCHGPAMQGQVLFKIPDGTKLVAPNVPKIAAGYSDDELARVIKYGVRPDSTGVMVMPSEALYAMTDQDLTAILSYIRATPDQGGKTEKSNFGPLIRMMIATGGFDSAPASPTYLDDAPTYDQGTQLGQGAYLARMACGECHGLDYKGRVFPGETNPPDLVVASAYTIDEFKHLLHTGIGLSDRDLGLMSEVAAQRFDAFSDEEMEAIHAFLMDRVANGQ